MRIGRALRRPRPMRGRAEPLTAGCRPRSPVDRRSAMPTPPEYHIEGKVFVATGAGRGIGRGIAEVLSEAGADGAITALTPAYVLPLAERLSRHSGRRVLGIVADGTRGDEMQKVVARVLAEFGRIDFWVNCIGDSIRAPLVPLPG